VERFFATVYTHELATAWFAAIEGLVPRLDAGARVADVSCGRGQSSVQIATHWPNTTVTGFDLHQPSVVAARAAAVEAGVDDRVTFAAADAAEIGPGPFEVVAFFDSLHDMGDPPAALRRAHEVLVDGGILRAPGMTMLRMPIFCWIIVGTSVLILIAFPVLTAALFGQLAGRHLGAHVFDPANGGVVLWQHLFWFFGHPEVYIVALLGCGRGRVPGCRVGWRRFHGPVGVLGSGAGVRCGWSGRGEGEGGVEGPAAVRGGPTGRPGVRW
jgi:hypothetical protein